MIFPPQLWAQQRSSASSVSPRKQMATIIYSGLGGLVLGLSTLSFYGRPQDHMENIGVGFAVGVIVGAAYTTYRAASTPHASSQRYSLMDFDQAHSQPWAKAGAFNGDLLGSRLRQKPEPVTALAWTFHF